MKEDIELRVSNMVEDITQAAIKNRLNLTICGGRIGFVDQEKRKIVALWDAEYKMPEEKDVGVC